MEFGSPFSTGIETLTPMTIQDGELEATTVLSSRPTRPIDHLYLTYMGERVASLRVLLRRMCHIQTVAPAASANDYIIRQVILNRQPLAWGYDTNALDTAKGVISTATTYNINWISGNFLSYLAPAFVGNRGSVNWSCIPDCGVYPMKLLTMMRSPSSYSAGVTSVDLATSTPSTNAKFWRANMLTTGAGAAVNSPQVTGAVTAQIPFYSKYKFCPTDGPYKNNSLSRTYTATDYFVTELSHSQTYGATTNAAVS